MEKTLRIDCPTLDMANRLWTNRTELAKSAQEEGYTKVDIALLGSSFYPLFRPATILARHSTNRQIPMNIKSYQAVLDLLATNEELVTVTCHQTDRCLLLNERGSSDRLIWQPNKYIGLNCKDLWRDSMDDYHRLRRELRQNGKIENFTYRLRRVDDSLCEFTKDYFLVDNFLGTPVRIATSRDWKYV